MLRKPDKSLLVKHWKTLAAPAGVFVFCIAVMLVLVDVFPGPNVPLAVAFYLIGTVLLCASIALRPFESGGVRSRYSAGLFLFAAMAFGASVNDFLDLFNLGRAASTLPVLFLGAALWVLAKAYPADFWFRRGAGGDGGDEGDGDENDGGGNPGSSS